MTWEPGHAEVDALLKGGELERVTPGGHIAIQDAVRAQFGGPG